MMTLYEMKNEYRELLLMAEEGEVDDETLRDTFEAIEGEIEVKAEGYAMVISELTNDVETIKAEEKRLKERRDRLTRSIDHMKMAVKEAMELTGKTKFKTALYSFGIRNNPPKMVIDNEGDIPAEYYIEQAPVLDKAALKDALSKGLDVPYAHLEQGTSLMIR